MPWVGMLTIVWLFFSIMNLQMMRCLVVDAKPVAMLDCFDKFVYVVGFDKDGEVKKVTLKHLRLVESHSPMGVTKRNGEILSEWVVN